MPKALRDELAADPYYSKCCLQVIPGHTCSGRITWEHALEYKGRQIQEKFAIIPLCWESHLGGGLNKKRNHWVALSRATEEDWKKYDRARDRWMQELRYLNKLYGKYVWQKNAKDLFK